VGFCRFVDEQASEGWAGEVAATVVVAQATASRHTE